MSNVKAIPDGYTTVTPFMNIKNAPEAIAFYEKAFGAVVVERHDTSKGQVMIAALKIGNALIHVSEANRDPETHSGTMLYVDHADAWWQRAVDAGCEVRVPLQDMFWGDRFGALSDKFGNRWAIAQRIENVSPEEADLRGREFEKKMHG
jgi:PhnB protein